MIARVLMTIALTLTLAACGDAGEPAPGTDGQGSPTSSPTTTGNETPAGADATEVSIEGLAFGQQEITVQPGATVTWVNNDSVGHTVTHGEDGQAVSEPMFDESVGIGEEVSVTFDEPGTYMVTCTIHPQMNMTVVVEE